MRGIVVTSRPITHDRAPFFLIQDGDGILGRYVLEKDEPIKVTVSKSERYCSGWYDIAKHENHVCEGARNVDPKFEACYECRNRTGFNPAFYNTDVISSAQTDYNQQPHSVYIAYFGSGLGKAGIMSDSRGLDRLWEQGALLYINLGSCANASQARSLEASLIERGLRNSVTKKQKEDVMRFKFDLGEENAKFASLINELDLESDQTIVSNLDHFFFGRYTGEQVTPISGEMISGRIAGMVGRYLVVENGGRLFGFWLSDLPGYNVTIEKLVERMDAEPLQSTLF